jgi:hypothetical protein
LKSEIQVWSTNFQISDAEIRGFHDISVTSISNTGVLNANAFNVDTQVSNAYI